MKRITPFLAIAAINVFNATGAELITNGNFESNVISAGTYTNLITVGLTGWSCGGNIDLVGTNYLASPVTNATQYVDLVGVGFGAITQVITTAGSTAYTLTFRYAKNTQAQLGSQMDAEVQIRFLDGTPKQPIEARLTELQATVFGATVTNIVSNITKASNYWSSVSIPFTTPASGTAVQIQFRSIAGDRTATGGIMVDDVSVQ